MSTDRQSLLAAAKSKQPLCECGHHRRSHYYDNEARPNVAAGVGRCHSSVMVEVPMGANITLCKCKAFKEKV